jgi:predicted cupin superfamily sugar epimerase
VGKTADYWIEKLRLIEHPEGGYFRETYRSEESIALEHLPDRYKVSHSFSTAIYYLLKGDQVSSLHRLESDELWNFYIGSSLTLHVITIAGEYSHLKLGTDPENGEIFQAVTHAGSWFGATVDDKSSFTLVGCSVAPGFDFSDFKLASRADLVKQFPEHSAIIKELTKD